MIHYTCDRCKREIDPEENARYVVRLEVYPASESGLDACEDDRDYLNELHHYLETAVDPADDDVSLEGPIELRFDLCPGCREKMLKNPLGREAASQLDFSPN